MRYEIGKYWVYSIGDIQLEVIIENPWILSSNYWNKKQNLELRVGKKGATWGFKSVKKITVHESEVEIAREKLVNDYLKSINLK